MIRFLLNIVRIIISIYLCAVVLLFAYFTVYKELYDDKFPMLQGYSYVKVPDDNLSPEYVKNDLPPLSVQDELMKRAIANGEQKKTELLQEHSNILERIKSRFRK